MESGRPAEAIIIAITGGADLLTRTQFKYLEKSSSYLANIISSLVGRDWSNVAQQCTVDSWKEALVGILTHCQENTKDLCGEYQIILHFKLNICSNWSWLES